MKVKVKEVIKRGKKKIKRNRVTVKTIATRAMLQKKNPTLNQTNKSLTSTTPKTLRSRYSQFNLLAIRFRGKQRKPKLSTT